MCGHEKEYLAERVVVSILFDSMQFAPLSGTTVQEIFDNWVAMNSKPIPAIVGGREVEDMGQADLCPLIVCCDDRELRRVGPMLHPDHRVRGKVRNQGDVKKWFEECLNDPDIPRLLKLKR